jgi:hypothetical protein
VITSRRTRWEEYVADIERGEVHIEVGLGILRKNWEDLGIAGWIMVKWISKNRIRKACRLD